jgi:hypothetical protein
MFSVMGLCAPFSTEARRTTNLSYDRAFAGSDWIVVYPEVIQNSSGAASNLRKSAVDFLPYLPRQKTEVQ